MKKIITIICLLLYINGVVQAQNISFFTDPNSSKKYGVKNEKGQIIVQPKYDDYQPVYNGYARVKYNEKWDLMDGSGKELTNFKYDFINFFTKDDLALVQLNGKYGYIDKSLKEVIPLTFESASSFFEGLATVRQQSNGTYKIGYIDKTGKMVIPYKYEIAREFNNGFAMVRFNNKWGFINQSGKEITPLKYDYVTLFYDGMAAVTINGKTGYINTDGKEIIPLIYDGAWNFKDGRAEVKLAGRNFFIDKSGKEFGTTTTQVNTGNSANISTNNKSDNGLSDFTKGHEAYTAKNYTDAHKYYNLSVEKGNINAMLQLGLLYYQGLGVTKSISESEKWFLKAANLGNANAMNIMGLALKSGEFGKSSLKQAEEWFIKAANLGNDEAMYELGTMYEFGLAGLDFKKAKEWYQKAADKGNAKAKETLATWNDNVVESTAGNTYLTLGYAEELKGNFKEAYNQYKLAADNGNVLAMYNMGVFHENGKGVVKDSYAASLYYDLAAKRGHDGALYALGNLYENGKAVDKNLETAKRYYTQSADKGNTLAKQALNRLSSTSSIPIKTVPAPPTPIKAIINKNISYLGKNGKYGLSDRKGNIIITPQFDYSLNFNRNGIAVASLNKKKGLINNNGKELTPFEYDNDLGDSEGVFLMRKRNPIPGNSLNDDTYFIDNTGKIILTDKDKPYKVDGPFYSGRALVKTPEGLGYIDKTGKMIIPAVYVSQSLIALTSPMWFTNGTAVVSLKDKTYALIDVNGKTLTKKNYYFISDNSPIFNFGEPQPEENIFVYKNNAEEKHGYLDITGKELTPAIYKYAAPFREGMGKVTNDTKQGFIDRTGKIAIPLTYEVALDFKEGLAAVRNQNKWGFIDKTGKIIIPLQYEYAGSFSEGLATAQINGKTGFINKKGEWVIAPQFQSTSGYFKEGMAGVMVNDLWGFINTSGKMVIQPKYPRYGFIDFEDGVKYIEVSNLKYALIDKTGKEFREP